METKEVTLRQCEVCRICKKRTDEKDMYNDHWGEEVIQSKCIRCVLSTVNRQKSVAGDKTEFVLIEKPRDQTLGEVIMNGYREQWSKLHITDEKNWDIWGQDTQDIQEKIDALNK